MDIFDIYPEYRRLTSQQKKQRITSAKQNQKDRAPNPQGDYIYDEVDWINFEVEDQKANKIKLCTYRQKSVETPQAVIIVFHGLNSHQGHGAHIAHYYSNFGFITVGFDHRGFGRSQGQKGYIQSQQQHLTDSLKFVHLVKKNYPDLPLFCMGLSMGGMVAYYLTLKHRELFDGAILMAPAIQIPQYGPIVQAVTKVGRFFIKKMKIPIQPPSGQASSNSQITDFVKEDPYYYNGYPWMSTIIMLVQSMQKTPQTFKNYDCPFIYVQGGLDKLVNPQGAFSLYDKSINIESQDKQVLFFQSMWHDIWHEPQIYEIMQRTTEWMLSRLQRITLRSNMSSRFMVGIRLTSNNQLKSQQCPAIYQEYERLSDYIKKQRIDKAQQDKYKSENPQGAYKYEQNETNWIEFYVDDKNKNKIKLCTYRKQAKDPKHARGIIVIFHGLNSHQGHGAHIAQYYSDKGFHCMGFDHRGFGKSGIDQQYGGKVESQEQHVNDSRLFVHLVKSYNDYKKYPFFCMGLSMGGMVAYQLTKTPDYKQLFIGAIMMAPAIYLPGLNLRINHFIYSNVIKLAKRGFGQRIPIDKLKQIPIVRSLIHVDGRGSRNPEITQFVLKDNFAFKGNPWISTLQMLVHSMGLSSDSFEKYECPFMYVQGGLDKLVNPKGAFELYKRSRTPCDDKQVLFYENMWHDIWHQPQIYDILLKTQKWMSHILEKYNKELQKKASNI